MRYQTGASKSSPRLNPSVAGGRFFVRSHRSSVSRQTAGSCTSELVVSLRGWGGGPSARILLFTREAEGGKASEELMSLLLSGGLSQGHPDAFPLTGDLKCDPAVRRHVTHTCATYAFMCAHCFQRCVCFLTLCFLTLCSCKMFLRLEVHFFTIYTGYYSKLVEINQNI